MISTEAWGMVELGKQCAEPQVFFIETKLYGVTLKYNLFIGKHWVFVTKGSNSNVCGEEFTMISSKLHKKHLLFPYRKQIFYYWVKKHSHK